jgi:prepilin-type processing-associated H-X9-DG protein
MGLSLMNYESTRRAFPRGRWNVDPADTSKHTVPDRSSSKSNDHSWQSVSLPYAEEQNIASQYDLKLPWFNTANRLPVSTPLSIFICPSVPETGRMDLNFTTDPKPAAGDYGCPNGVGQAAYDNAPALGPYPPADPGYPSVEDGSRVIGVLHKVFKRSPTRMKDIVDGTSKTLLITESAGKPDVYTKGAKGDSTGRQLMVVAGAGWADPDSGFTVNAEPPINFTNDDEIYAFHTGGAQACFADGSTRMLISTIANEILVSYVTRGGSETVNAQE